MGVRVSDHLTVPLCAFHHQELHASGREELYWAMRGVDPVEWMEKFRDLDNSQ